MMPTHETQEAIFTRHRSRVFAVAYRLVGTVSDAEDVVQETWLRWNGTDTANVRSPEAWLVTTASRLGIDHLRRLRARRESYVGPWLPEPIVEPANAEPVPTPEEQIALADEVSIALLHMLERLAPEERTAFLLHEAFDYDYADLATILGKSQAACRQIVSRARRRVSDERPRFEASPADHARLASAFADALMKEDPQALLASLGKEAVLYTDGGGRVTAALNPIYGADRIMRFFLGITRKFPEPYAVDAVRINGRAGFTLGRGKEIASIVSFDIRDGLIANIYIMRNPDKIARAAQALGRPLLGA